MEYARFAGVSSFEAPFGHRHDASLPFSAFHQPHASLARPPFFVPGAPTSMWARPMAFQHVPAGFDAGYADPIFRSAVSPPRFVMPPPQHQQPPALVPPPRLVLPAPTPHAGRRMSPSLPSPLSGRRSPSRNKAVVRLPLEHGDAIEGRERSLWRREARAGPLLHSRSRSTVGEALNGVTTSPHPDEAEADGSRGILPATLDIFLPSPLIWCEYVDELLEEKAFARDKGEDVVDDLVVPPAPASRLMPTVAVPEFHPRPSPFGSLRAPSPSPDPSRAVSAGSQLSLAELTAGLGIAEEDILPPTPPAQPLGAQLAAPSPRRHVPRLSVATTASHARTASQVSDAAVHLGAEDMTDEARALTRSQSLAALKRLYHAHRRSATTSGDLGAVWRAEHHPRASSLLSADAAVFRPRVLVTAESEPAASDVDTSAQPSRSDALSSWLSEATTSDVDSVATTTHPADGGDGGPHAHRGDRWRSFKFPLPAFPRPPTTPGGSTPADAGTFGRARAATLQASMRMQRETLGPERPSLGVDTTPVSAAAAQRVDTWLPMPDTSPFSAASFDGKLVRRASHQRLAHKGSPAGAHREEAPSMRHSLSSESSGLPSLSDHRSTASDRHRAADEPSPAEILEGLLREGFARLRDDLVGHLDYVAATTSAPAALSEEAAARVAFLASQRMLQQVEAAVAGVPSTSSVPALDVPALVAALIEPLQAAVPAALNVGTLVEQVVDRLQPMVASITDTIDGLSKASTAERASLDAAVAALADAKVRADAELERQGTRIADDARTIEGLRDELGAARLALQEAELGRAAALNAGDATKRELQAIIDERTGLHNEIIAVRAELRVAVAGRERADEDLAASRAAVEDLRDRRARSEGQQESLAAAIEEARAEAASLRMELAAKDALLLATSEARGRDGAVREQLASLTAEYEASRERVAQRERELLEASLRTERELAEARAAISELEADVARQERLATRTPTGDPADVASWSTPSTVRHHAATPSWDSSFASDSELPLPEGDEAIDSPLVATFPPTPGKVAKGDDGWWCAQ